MKNSTESYKMSPHQPGETESEYAVRDTMSKYPQQREYEIQKERA